MAARVISRSYTAGLLKNGNNFAIQKVKRFKFLFWQKCELQKVQFSEWAIFRDCRPVMFCLRKKYVKPIDEMILRKQIFDRQHFDGQNVT